VSPTRRFPWGTNVERIVPTCWRRVDANASRGTRSTALFQAESGNRSDGGEGLREEEKRRGGEEERTWATSLKHLKKDKRMRAALQTVFMEAHDRGERGTRERENDSLFYGGTLWGPSIDNSLSQLYRTRQL